MRTERTRALLLPLLSSILLSAALQVQAQAQAQIWWVSTTHSTSLADGTPLDDGELARVRAGEAARAQRGAGHWLAIAGFVPADVDALARRPGVPAGRLDHMAFSLLSNEAGALDGDVLSVTPGGGLVVLVPEEALAASLGVSGSGLDVDALAYDAEGALLFSLQSNLPDSVLGPVADGDVLRRDAAGQLTRLYSEDEVQAAFSAATGLSSAIGDVQGLSFEAGELCVLTQGPSSHDGGLLRIAPTPALLFAEAEVGLAGAELDAIARVAATQDADLPRLWIDPQQAGAGSSMSASYAGGAASQSVLVLAAGSSGWFDAPYLGGAGGFLMDPLDPWLLQAAENGYPIVGLDGVGAAQVGFSLPAGLSGGVGLGGEMGWTFQTVELSQLVVAEPFRVQL